MRIRERYYYGLVMMGIDAFAFTGLFLPRAFSFIFFAVVMYGGSISWLMLYPKLARRYHWSL